MCLLCTFFYPTNPLTTWRKDNSLARMGLMTFEEGALLYGKVGYAVQSFDRDASRKFKGYASISGNSNGSSKYDVCLTGPLDKKGLGYMVSFFQNYDRGSGINYQFTPWFDQTSIAKVGIQKKYKKGKVKLLYKYGDSRMVMSNYVPLKYEGDGEFSELSTFDLGKDSYIPGNGLVPVTDVYGNQTIADLSEDKFNRSINHSFYLIGDHTFGKGPKMTYTVMYQDAKATMPVIFPISLSTDISTIDADGTVYNTDGTVSYGQGVTTQLIPQSDCKTLEGRLQFTHTLGTHSLRGGLQYQMYHRQYESLNGYFNMTVEGNPKVNYDGVYPAAWTGVYGNKYDDQWNKVALYLGDDFSIGSRLELGVGGRIEHQKYQELHNPFSGESLPDDSHLIDYDSNNLNWVATGNMVFKITRDAGILGDFTTLNEWESRWDYQRDANGVPMVVVGQTGTKAMSTIPFDKQISVLKWGAGLYYNLGSKLNIVSKVTYIRKNNVSCTEASLENKNDAYHRRADFGPEFYDIETKGWTTDIVANPFKNFNIHFLVTLQDPQYKNYSLAAKFDNPSFEQTYNYSNNTVTALSKFLMEIDPSYKFYQGKMKAWLSLRYYGKQYGTTTNTVSYNPWWESFGGLEYTMSRNVKFSLTVINFLDQRGIKGNLVSAQQLEQGERDGKGVTASAIRPRQVELSVDFKF